MKTENNYLTHIICSAPGLWGKGKTKKEAKENCRKAGAGGKDFDRAIYYLVHKDVVIEGGAIVYKPNLVDDPKDGFYVQIPS